MHLAQQHSQDALCQNAFLLQLPFVSNHWTHDQQSCHTIQPMEHDAAQLHAILALLPVQIVPIENIEGRKAAEEGDTCLRRTFSGVDLNRNWGTEWKQQVCT